MQVFMETAVAFSQNLIRCFFDQSSRVFFDL